MELDTTEYDNLNSGISLMNLEEEDLTNSSLRLRYDWYVNSNAHNVGVYTLDGTSSFNGTMFTQSLSAWNTSTTMTDRFLFIFNESKKFFSKGSGIEVSLSGVENFNSVGNNILPLYNNKEAYSLKLRLIDSDSNLKTITIDDFVIKFYPNKNTYYLNFSVDDLPFDVYGFYIYLDYSIYAYQDLVNYVGTNNNMLHHAGFKDLAIDIKETAADKTDGLLANIIQIVTNIKNNILELPQNIANSIKGFFDNVVNALQELGNSILEGIKNLFIPSEQDIISMKEDWEQLLASRFGALYEVIQLIDDYAKSFVASEKSTILFPSVSIPLGEVDFVFGGWEVKVIPDGFDVLVGALKTIISIVCTVLFVNGMRDKFERLVSR